MYAIGESVKTADKTGALMNEKALYTMNYGVYIVSTKSKEKMIWYRKFILS